MLNQAYESDVNESRQEAMWLDLVPPELEWDESEEALVVEDILGASRTHEYS